MNLPSGDVMTSFGWKQHSPGATVPPGLPMVINSFPSALNHAAPRWPRGPRPGPPGTAGRPPPGRPPPPTSRAGRGRRTPTAATRRTGSVVLTIGDPDVAIAIDVDPVREDQQTFPEP